MAVQSEEEEEDHVQLLRYVTKIELAEEHPLLVLILDHSLQCANQLAVEWVTYTCVLV